MEGLALSDLVERGSGICLFRRLVVAEPTAGLAQHSGSKYAKDVKLVMKTAKEKFQKQNVK